MDRQERLAPARRPGVNARLRAHLAWRRADARRRSERRKLLARFPRGGVGAEVGTWKGDFADRLISLTHPTRLYLIDPWEHRDEIAYEDAIFGGATGDGQSEMDSVHQGVLRRFRADIERGRVEVRRMRSPDAAAQLEDGSLDWAYIDGDHTYEAVKADLHAYCRLLKSGGLLAGDDYGVPGWWDDGVTKAVDEFARTGRCAGPAIIGSQFVFTKI